MTNSLPQWAVSVVETGDEFGVAKRLRKIDVETYCPALTVRVRRKRMRRPIEVAANIANSYPSSSSDLRSLALRTTRGSLISASSDSW